jgi:pyruvate, water dikinase
LADALQVGVFGGKAVQLGAAIRNGLPVPGGYALSPEVVEGVVREETSVIAALVEACEALGPTAVRSSALDEDSSGASFAGAHLSVLGVSGVEATIAAVRAVRDSGQDAGAQHYRARMGLGLGAHMAVVIQRLVDAECAGVMFTRNPVTAADERVIEASWGLGETVVSGMVTPDAYRVARGGTVLDRRLGEKDVALRVVSDPRGVVTTREVPVGADLFDAFCLGPPEVAALDLLAAECDRVYGSTEHDIEFAFRDGEIFLLQRRPITRA